MNFVIPKEVREIGDKLMRGGYRTYLVGGCVRDLLLGEEPKDWDIATDAKPEEIQKIFPDSVYENKFGTVLVKILNSKSEIRNKFKIQSVEVTTFRLEGKYTDKRHPDEVKFAKTIEEDLGRRDFTINAMALNLNSKHEARNSKQIQNYKLSNSERLKFKNLDLNIVPTSSRMLDEIGISNFEFRISDFTIVDPFGGQKDLKNKIIRAVGDPKERFSEDALRLLRAVRFYSQFGFKIEKKTEDAIKSGAKFLKFIAYERIRDEFTKLIMSDGAADGVFKLEEVGLLQYILPELREGIGCEQNRHHIYTVFEHNVRALEYAAKKNYSLEIRLASLLHDIGKPQTKRGRGENSTFYNHEMVSERMAKQALMRLKSSNEIIEKVRHLVRYHMFYYNVGEVSEAGVRRFIARVGVENIDDIMKVREADRIGSRVPKAFPYKLRHLLFMIEKVRHDPVHPKMLAVRGDNVMEILKIPPGPKVGQILFMLLEEVLDDPTKNTKENLEKRIKDLGKLSDTELKKLSEKAKSKKEEFESGIEQEMKKKYYVK